MKQLRRTPPLRKTHSIPVKQFFVLCLASVTLLGLFSCNSRSTRGEIKSVGERASTPELDVPIIRVAVNKGVREVRLTSVGGAAEVKNERGERIGVVPASGEILVKPSAGQLLITGAVQGQRTPVLNLECGTAEALIRVNGRAVAPAITVYADPRRAHTLTTIAHLDLETYLAGVLSGEVPVGSWHSEALKAQAIASRSYAIYQMKAHTHDSYDVESTVADQVFKPLQSRNPKLEAVLTETEGLIVTQDGRLFPAYFHSTCGGHTTSSTRAFPERTAVFDTLSGTRCPFCTASPAFEWRARLAKSEMEKKLRVSSDVRKSGKRFGRITAIETVGGTGWPRRADQFRIRHTNGVLTVPSQRFRLIVGAMKLKSACVTRIVDRGSELEFQGRGFGHGVGMCQYGSQGMANKGYSYKQILGLYYPGGELTRLYDRSFAKSK